MLHDSVPMAVAVARGANCGSNISRNLCTARKTVCFAAPELDFSAAAISSIPQPSQCLITKAMRSAGVKLCSAVSICLRSSTLRVIRHLRARSLSAGIFLLALAHAIDGVICGNAINPRREIGLRGKLFKFLISTQKCLLHYFLGVVMVAGQTVREPKN